MTPVAAEGFLPEIAHCTALLDEQSMSRDVNHTTNALALIEPSRICWALAGEASLHPQELLWGSVFGLC